MRHAHNQSPPAPVRDERRDDYRVVIIAACFPMIVIGIELIVAGLMTPAIVVFVLLCGLVTAMLIDTQHRADDH